MREDWLIVVWEGDVGSENEKKCLLPLLEVQPIGQRRSGGVSGWR